MYILTVLPKIIVLNYPVIMHFTDNYVFLDIYVIIIYISTLQGQDTVYNVDNVAGRTIPQ